MTRLVAAQVKDLPDTLPEYDSCLRRQTGHTLKEIAAAASGLPWEEVGKRISGTLVAVVPTTYGGGVIPGFAQAVRGIAAYLGFESLVTGRLNLAGLREALERKADIIAIADDDDFLAVNTSSGRVVDNAAATGRGYAAAMKLQQGCLKDREVLVIGLGRVGRSAVETLKKFQARVVVYDIDARKRAFFEKDTSVLVAHDLEEALNQHYLILDASPGAGIIDIRHLKGESCVFAPGIPLGVTEAGAVFLGDRLVHDPLQIGVATMLVGALSP